MTKLTCFFVLGRQRAHMSNVIRDGAEGKNDTSSGGGDVFSNLMGALGNMMGGGLKTKPKSTKRIPRYLHRGKSKKMEKSTNLSQPCAVLQINLLRIISDR